MLDDECRALADRLYAECSAIRENIEKAASVLAEWLKGILGWLTPELTPVRVAACDPEGLLQAIISFYSYGAR